MESQDYDDVLNEIFQPRAYNDIPEWKDSTKYDTDKNVDIAKLNDVVCCANIRIDEYSPILRRCIRKVWESRSIPASQRPDNVSESERDKMSRYCSFHCKKYVAFHLAYKKICREEVTFQSVEMNRQNMNILADLKLRCALYRKAFIRVFFQRDGECASDLRHLEAIRILEREARDLKRRVSEMEGPIASEPSKKRVVSSSERLFFDATRNLEVATRVKDKKIAPVKSKKKKGASKKVTSVSSDDDVFEAITLYSTFFASEFPIKSRNRLFGALGDLINRAFPFEVSIDPKGPYYSETDKIHMDPVYQKMYVEAYGNTQTELMEDFMSNSVWRLFNGVFEAYANKNGNLFSLALFHMDAFIAKRLGITLQDVELKFIPVLIRQNIETGENLVVEKNQLSRWSTFGNILLRFHWIDEKAARGDRLFEEYNVALGIYPMSAFKAMVYFINAYYLFYRDLEDAYDYLYNFFPEIGLIIKSTDTPVDQDTLNRLYTLVQWVKRLRTSETVLNSLKVLLSALERAPPDYRTEEWKTVYSTVDKWTIYQEDWVKTGKKFGGNIESNIRSNDFFIAMNSDPWLVATKFRVASLYGTALNRNRLVELKALTGNLEKKKTESPLEGLESFLDKKMSIKKSLN